MTDSVKVAELVTFTCVLIRMWLAFSQAIGATANIQSPKCGRTRSFLTGFQFGGIKLKGCSAGGWRSGMQRSEK